MEGKSFHYENLSTIKVKRYATANNPAIASIASNPSILSPTGHSSRYLNPYHSMLLQTHLKLLYRLSSQKCHCDNQ
jgi:hypothetical protein